jgi:cobalt-precorrin 5A hydrolase / precorrin-3B C17-methyltransferase
VIVSTSAAIVLLGPGGLPVAERIAAAIVGLELYGPRASMSAEAGIVLYRDFAATLRDLFAAGRPIVALCSSGIVIRILAPLLEDKGSEPPVVAVAEVGSIAVPLLGGHHGANRLARQIGQALGCPAAITTAGDARFQLALDDPPPGWHVRNPEAAKAIVSALLQGRAVGLNVETADPAWLRIGGAPFAAHGDLEVRITDRADPGSATRLVIHPKTLALGVGCERGIALEELSELVAGTLERHEVAPGAIACVVSLDLKAAERAIHGLAAQLGAPARFYPASRLEAETPRLAHPSAAVFAATGCHGVAEAAALAAAGPDGELIVAKTRSGRATCALARAPTPLDPARIGRPQGRLAIVGLGPGGADWRTAEATALLADAEDWVGYARYLELIALPPWRRVVRHAFALGEEEMRVRCALDLAADGRRVALISSGDAGIYAMAGLAFELLERGDDPAWQRVAIVVSPGISALQSAAARVGAPLGHDFCAISLSDLLTPWAEIERRLRAAASGDFVTALYNPASGQRREGLARAFEILCAARPPETPIVHARNLGRAGETVAISRLPEFDPSTVDMLSLLIVGSSQTHAFATPDGRSFVYTPRGYGLADRPAP